MIYFEHRAVINPVFTQDDADFLREHLKEYLNELNEQSAFFDNEHQILTIQRLLNAFEH